MKQYILKLVSTTEYRLYEGTTAVSDTDVANLFLTAGEAYFSFDFDGNTPSATDSLVIIDSLNTTIITNTGLTDTIAENKNYKGTWSANATAFDTFEELGGVTMDESQLSNLMRKIKGADATELTSLFRMSDLGSGWYKWTGQLWTLDGTTPVQSFTAGGATYLIQSQHTYYINVSKYSSKGSGSGNRHILMYMQGNSFDETSHTQQGACFFVLGKNSTTGNDTTSYAEIIFNFQTGGRNDFSVLHPAEVVNYLTSTSGYRPLSANQGKVLNDKILGASGVIAVWASIGTGSSYTKRALQVTLNISETGLTIPADTWTSLGITMPTGFIPTITMLGSVTANNNGTFEAGLVRVNTDGTVEVHTSGATTDIYGSIVFPVAA